MSKKFLLIDGSSLLFRAHFALGRLSAPDGRESGGLYGLLTSLRKAVGDYKPDFVGVIFDRPEPTFRHVRYPDYKGNRPEMPEGLQAQMPYIEPMVSAMGYPYLALPGFEADDLIGTLALQAEEAGMECEILTADKDLLQLVTEKTSVIHTKWENMKLGLTQVKEKFGVFPNQVVDVIALWGDASDNIPGVTGFGEKTAKELIGKYGSLAELYAHIDEIKGKKRETLEAEKEMALLSQELAKVECHAPVQFSAEQFSPRPPDRDKCREYFTSWNFRTLLNEFGSPEPAGAAGQSGSPAAETLTHPAIEAEKVEAGAFQDFIRQHATGLRLVKSEGSVELTAANESQAVTFAASPEQATDLLAGAKKLLIADLKGTAHRFPLLADVLFAHGEDPLLMDALLRPDEPGWSLPILAQALHLPYSASSASEARLLVTAAPRLEEKLAAEGMAKLYLELELPVAEVLYRMEAAGVLIDAAALAELSRDFAVRLVKLEERAHALAGAPFNLASPKQLGEVLFEKMGLPVLKKTSKTKSYSTDASVLEELAAEHEIARILLEHRELSKLKGTYLDALPEFIKADGRIHTTFDQTGAATGRLSSRDPNMQNIPARGEWGAAIRRAMIAPPGAILLGADYSQIELRLMAHLAEDEAMIAAFQAGRDIHTETAAAVFSCAPALVTDEMRRGAKAVNFGIIYGQGGFSLARQIGVHPREAGRFIEAYFARFPGVKRYIDVTRASALDQGFVTTLLGRRRNFKDLDRQPFVRKEAGLRAAVNATIQGSAADLMKVAMLALHREFNKSGSPFKMLLQVHDELLLEGPPDATNLASEQLKACMESAAVLRVPLLAEVHQGNNWAATKG